MKKLTTPISRFDRIKGYPYKPRYCHVGNSLQMHYVDNLLGDETIIMLHGEPSWSFLYRKMINVFQSEGWRTIAPDLIGFGKSDKPVFKKDYTYANHQRWLETWFESLDIQETYLFVQDWGGLLGLRMAVKYKSKIKGVIIANTFLPTGQVPPNEAFKNWRDFSQKVPAFPVGKIIDMATTSKITPDILAGYNAPFPDESYKEGARQFPLLVPFDYDDPECVNNRETWKELKKWKKPTLTLFSDQDPIMQGLDRIFQERIPGCKGQPHETIENAGHFLQEDKGEEIAEKIIAWVKKLNKD